jgi:CysZ protein
MKAFTRGASYFFMGLRWLPRPRLRRFVVIPLLVNTLLFSTAIWWGAGQFEALMTWLLSFLPNWEWLDWLRWLLWPLFAITVLVLSFYTFTLAANLLASPFNGLLSERVETMVRPDAKSTESGNIWKEIALAPMAEIKKIVYFLLWVSVLFLLLWGLAFLVPPISVAAPFIWGGFSAWMLALQYTDYPMGNHGIRFREQRRLLKRKRLMVLGFGSAVLLLTMIPVVNFVAMPAAVIGATLMWVEQFGDAASDESRS